MRSMRLRSCKSLSVNCSRWHNRGFGVCQCLSTQAAAGRQKVIFSGIQPTGVPHLGNYLGALQQWVRLQQTEADDTRLLYSLVDLHAITIKQDPAQLRQWRRESLATLLAIGLDPARSVIFFQSDVPAHSELMWILSCTASVARLSHMTQWKSKLNLPENAKPLDVPLQLGLFTYPVLQAADILVHSATHVPVGDDQAQHLEFARSLAAAFNNQYNNNTEVLVEPETVLSQAKRVMSLTNPAKKMSKSDASEKSRILVTDSREVVRRKVKAAVTDSIEGVSYDPDQRPGIANLVDIVVYLRQSQRQQSPDVAGAKSVEEEARELVSGIHSKSALKDLVTDVIDEHLEPIRARYLDIMHNELDYLVDVAEEGAELARASADATLRRVRDVVGFGGF